MTLVRFAKKEIFIGMFLLLAGTPSIEAKMMEKRCQRSALCPVKVGKSALKMALFLALGKLYWDNVHTPFAKTHEYWVKVADGGFAVLGWDAIKPLGAATKEMVEGHIDYVLDTITGSCPDDSTDTSDTTTTVATQTAATPAA